MSIDPVTPRTVEISAAIREDARTRRLDIS